MLLTHLPSKRSEGGAGIRSPGDNEQQDDDERDLRHLPFALHLMQPLHRVSGSLTADLRYRSVMQMGEVRRTMTNEPAAPCDLCCHRHASLQGEPDVGGNPTRWSKRRRVGERAATEGNEERGEERVPTVWCDGWP